VAVAVGTGTTLAGIAAELGRDWSITGIAALKGAGDLAANVTAMLSSIDADSVADWTILDDYHCGGFARVSPRLREFMLAFEAVQGVQLEPVYTGKLLLAIHSLLQRGDWDPGAAVLAVHTGGLQGRRGFSWLTGTEPASQ
jgi:1-aminocyclopropane-1-carboxylate deaminase